jgi:hypothetical protein
MVSSCEKSPPTASAISRAVSSPSLSASAIPADDPPTLSFSTAGTTSEAIDTSSDRNVKNVKPKIIAGEWLSRLPNHPDRRASKAVRPRKEKNKEVDELVKELDKIHFPDTPSPVKTKRPKKKKQASRSGRWRLDLDESL